MCWRATRRPVRAGAGSGDLPRSHPRLDRHFTFSIVDCGSSMDAPVTQEALRDLNALIVVSSPWADGASAAAQTMEWLVEHGKTGLLQRSVVVLNDSDGHSDKRTRLVLAREFVDRGQRVSRFRSIRICGPAGS
jgi:MinD-like ATPase involved in chromosome partitioning or flagellar assembly